MDSDQIATLLSQVPLFADLDEAQCRAISVKGYLKHYPHNYMLSANTSDNALYVVLSGELTAVKNREDDQEPVEVIRYATRHFFESFHLTGSSRADRMKVLEDVELLVLSRATLDEIILSFLHKLTFFSELPEEQLQTIAHEVYLECYNPGEILFRQGDPARALYIVISGEVSMIKHSEDDGETIEEEIAAYRRGSSFGERGVLGSQPRAGTAKIEERTALLILPSDKFQALATKYTDIAFGLYRYLAEQLEEQSLAFWRAARDIEKMQGLIQSTKMAALGQLVAGVAHEINTPVGTISTDSYQLKRYLDKAKKTYEDLPQVIQAFYEDNHLQVIADELELELDEPTKQLVERYVSQQLDYVSDYYKRARIERLLRNMGAISGELNEASDRIKGIVKSLANFARLDEAELKAVDIHEGIDSTLALLHHELKYKVIVKKRYDDLPEITCYPNQLNQVFMNILMNAIQSLELDKLEDGKKGLIRIETHREGGWAVIAISDTGKGIPPHHLEKIFEPFFSTKGAAAAAGGLGLGLGLSISHKIIHEKHLGKLEVESEKGKGTTFFIKLPLDRSVTITSTQK